MNFAGFAKASAPPQAWQLNPNLKRVAAEDDELSLSDAQEQLLRSADLKYATVTTTENLEALQLTFEENVENSKKERWHGQERWQGRESEEARLTGILHPHSFIRALQRGGVDARLENSKYARLWLNEDVRQGRVGLTAWVANEDTGKIQARTVTTLQYPYGPEWSLMHFNKYNVPTAERYRGWRTALLHLIIANIITEEETDRAFGKVTLGAHTEFYREQLQQNRNRRMGIQI